MNLLIIFVSFTRAVSVVTFDDSTLTVAEGDGLYTIYFSHSGSIGGPFQNYSSDGLHTLSFTAALSNYTASGMLLFTIFTCLYMLNACFLHVIYM